jgi:hypothetical protein
LRTDYESLFCHDETRKNKLLKNIKKSEQIFQASPSKKNLKEKFLLEE